MIFLLDNFDSFTYNLAQLLQICGAQVVVRRVSETSLIEICNLQPSHLVFSPGPGHPSEHPFMFELLEKFSAQLPILGVCLGMQAINLYCGGTLRRDEKPMHGKTSFITHSAENIFAHVQNPLQVARYHSLLVDEPGKDLQVSAKTSDGKIMALHHASQKLFGVQFHPESYLSEAGQQLMKNFCAYE